MITFETIGKLELATLKEGDLVQVLGEFSEGDVALMTGKVYPALHVSSNRLVTIANGLKVEVFPTPLGDKDVTKKYVNERDDKIKEQVNNLHTKRDAIKWRSGLRVTDELQLYIHDGVEYLPDSEAVPFTTGSSFDADNWVLNNLAVTDYVDSNAASWVIKKSLIVNDAVDKCDGCTINGTRYMFCSELSGKVTEINLVGITPYIKVDGDIEYLVNPKYYSVGSVTVLGLWGDNTGVNDSVSSHNAAIEMAIKHSKEFIQEAGKYKISSPVFMDAAKGCVFKFLGVLKPTPELDDYALKIGGELNSIYTPKVSGHGIDGVNKGIGLVPITNDTTKRWNQSKNTIYNPELNDLSEGFGFQCGATIGGINSGCYYNTIYTPQLTRVKTGFNFKDGLGADPASLTTRTTIYNPIHTFGVESFKCTSCETLDVYSPKWEFITGSLCFAPHSGSNAVSLNHSIKFYGGAAEQCNGLKWDIAAAMSGFFGTFTDYRGEINAAQYKGQTTNQTLVDNIDIISPSSTHDFTANFWNKRKNKQFNLSINNDSVKLDCTSKLFNFIDNKILVTGVDLVNLDPAFTSNPFLSVGAFTALHTRSDAQSTNLGMSWGRFNDLYVKNAPVVGSDYRIKKNVKSIPQELLDFFISNEIVQYELIDNTSNRTHYGIVITEDFLVGLSKVVSLDSCAAFCHSVFTDNDGSNIKKMVGGVSLGDLWQVRYDEYQNILLEAMRRKLLLI